MPASVDLTTLSDDLPVFLQNGIGVGYSAIDVRRAVGVALQEGAVEAGDFKVSQRAAGAGMAVDVAAGEAVVQGDTVADEGKYYVRRNAAFTGATEITATAADGANPRVDQVILEIKNDVHDGSGLNRGRVRYLPGTATAGATLANRTGAAALPNSAVRLADVLMPAAAANVPNANIRDRRPWARGARFQISDGGGDISMTIVAPALIGAAMRLETSGNPIRITSQAILEGATVAGPRAAFNFALDAADVYSTNMQYSVVLGTMTQVTIAIDRIGLAAGSHTFQQKWAETSNDVILRRSAALPLVTTVEELVQQNAENSGA